MRTTRLGQWRGEFRDARRPIARGGARRVRAMRVLTAGSIVASMAAFVAHASGAHAAGAVTVTPSPGWEAPIATPDATLDLGTRDGVAQVAAAWRYHDVAIREVDFRAVGPDRKPSGPSNRTYDIEPRAGAADFDDSGWEVIDPSTLEARRANGRLCFNWYRINITVPERVGAFATDGALVVFDVVVDDYAEVWVDGQLPRRLGVGGGPLVGGWNVSNRLVVGRDVHPGQKIQLAVFGANGPLSASPQNYIWVRSARLDFYSKRPFGGAARPVATQIVRRDPALDRLVSPDAQLEQIASGFQFTEGPLWMPEGFLLFSDPNANIIYRWTPDGEVSVFRSPSGYAGDDVAEYGQPGSNGLTLDPQGRLTIAQHGNHRIVRVEADGSESVLAERFQGKRLNSPNDLVYRSDGVLYFSDPPFGLPKFYDDPRKQLPYSGVFRWHDGELSLASTDLKGPNGLAFSPDEKFLYVDNWDERRKIVMRYEVRADGSLAKGRTFFDMTKAPGDEALDGLKVDELGNVYVSGPGGLWVLSPEGKHLGTIVGPQLAANFAWGDADGKTLYLTARSGVYRLRMNVAGAGWSHQSRKPVRDVVDALPSATF